MSWRVRLAIVLLSVLSAVWADSPEQNSLDLGGGLTVHIDRLNKENATFLDNHALRLDYSGVGVSVQKAERKPAFQIGLYTEDKVEGRKKKADMLVPVFIGFKATALIALLITGMGALTLKALMAAKLALLVASAIFVSKLFHHKQSSGYYSEGHSSDHNPIFVDYPSATGYSPSASGSYLTYANYGPSAVGGLDAAETAPQYAIFAAPAAANISANIAAKRRDVQQKKSPSQAPLPVPYVSVRKYTIEH